MSFFRVVQRLFIMLLLSALVLELTLALPQQQAEKAPLLTELKPQEAVPAATFGSFANLTVANTEDLSLPYAYLLVNGDRCGDFNAGSLSVRVYAGDVLTLDGSAYLRELSFDITVDSAAVDRNYFRQTVHCAGAAAEIGSIVFR